jgi:23S rRNA-/tRNA-specific pseudouridylate synthase
MKRKIAPYQIVYEDQDILVVNKQREVFSIRTKDKRTYAHNLYHYLHEYLSKKNERPYIVHRLDYETSGLIIFAKSKVLKDSLQSAFEKRQVIRRYEAVIEERIEPGLHWEIKQYLSSNGKGGMVYETDPSLGKEAITHLTSANQIQIGTVLSITIETGRRAQIRKAIQSLGFHLLGDKKYSQSEAKRMYLNAYSLTFPEDMPIQKKNFEVKPLWLL